MKLEMDKMRKLKRTRNWKWAGGFNADEFATPEELEEAEIKREIELEEKEERKRWSGKCKEVTQMEAEMKAKEDALQKRLAEEKKKEKRRKRSSDNKRLSCRDLKTKKREVERKKMKEREERGENDNVRAGRLWMQTTMIQKKKYKLEKKLLNS